MGGKWKCSNFLPSKKYDTKKNHRHSQAAKKAALSKILGYDSWINYEKLKLALILLLHFCEHFSLKLKKLIT